jgi:hypothetical protein
MRTKDSNETRIQPKRPGGRRLEGSKYTQKGANLQRRLLVNMANIEKEKVAVTIYTATHRLDGTYFMWPGTPFIDDLNGRQKEFIALRDVEITYMHNGVEMQAWYDFIAVSVASITLFCPSPKMVGAGRQTLEIEPGVAALAMR